MNVFFQVNDAALTWFKVYNALQVKLDKIGFSDEMSKLLTKPVEDSSTANYFIMFALIGVLKHKPDEDSKFDIPVRNGIAKNKRRE